MPHPQQLTIQQAISRAEKATKQGNTALAFKLYNAVLLHQPNHRVAKENISKLQKELPHDRSVQVEAETPSQDQINALVNLYHSGQMIKTEQACRELLHAYSESLIVFNILGSALQGQGKLQEAVESYNSAIQLKPDFAETYNNRGIALKKIGQMERAVKSYEKAIQLKPDYAEAYNNRGNALKEIGQNERAVKSYEKAIQLKPDFAEAYSNRGNALEAIGQLEQAVESYNSAIQLKPDYADAYNNRGAALQAIGQLEQAVESYGKAIQFKPNYSEAYYNRGNALKAIGQMERAVKSYEQAIQLKPDYAKAYNNRGIALKEIGQMEQAVKSYEKAIQLNPNLFEAHSNYLLTLNYLADQSSTKMMEEARHFGDLTARQALPYRDWRKAPESDQRLHVGLVSGDLRTHPVGFFVEGILAALASNNSSQLKIIVYQSNLRTDALTERVKTYCHGWHSVVGVSDENLARQIHDDGINILIDLSGHTALNRLPMFAWKPAPVQVSWLGYFATTGVAEMDYLIADEVGVLPEHRGDFTEEIWYLPDSRLCFTPPENAPDVASLPALSNGHVTFGCFQHLAKITDKVLDVWSLVLKSLPDARLRLQNKPLGDAAVRDRFQERLQQHGIDPVKVLMSGQVSRSEYLAVHAEVDALLDTFPYPGGTTTCEALWMGVPTVTLAGATLLARQGASLLTAAGLPGWVANCEDEYVTKAVTLASDLPRLAMLRSRLREQMRQSPLFDAKRFAQNLEMTLQAMWQLKQAEQKPEMKDIRKKEKHAATSAVND